MLNQTLNAAVGNAKLKCVDHKGVLHHVMDIEFLVEFTMEIANGLGIELKQAYRSLSKHSMDLVRVPIDNLVLYATITDDDGQLVIPRIFGDKLILSIGPKDETPEMKICMFFHWDDDSLLFFAHRQRQSVDLKLENAQTGFDLEDMTDDLAASVAADVEDRVIRGDVNSEKN